MGGRRGPRRLDRHRSNLDTSEDDRQRSRARSLWLLSLRMWTPGADRQAYGVMRTLHVVILAGAILGAAWILRPASVEQVSQVELQRREEAMRWAQERFTEAKARECAVSAGKASSASWLQ